MPDVSIYILYAYVYQSLRNLDEHPFETTRSTLVISVSSRCLASTSAF